MLRPYCQYIVCFWGVLCLALFGVVATGQAAQHVWTNSIGMKFVLIPSGSFMMGADKEMDEAAEADEMPSHHVTISRPFYIGMIEVTQKQWKSVMGNNPSTFKYGRSPVETVSWDDVQVFIRRLNALENTDRYRLPSEAEWEYAARAGRSTRHCLGNDQAALDLCAWYRDNASRGTHPVGMKRPNDWGLYDMYGNVWEWVQDRYEPYSEHPVTDPRGSASGDRRVNRGCSWRENAWYCRATPRIDSNPDFQSADLGFRLAVSFP
jgi:formylglycine-generating enzyme required for sulfatase activity